MSSLAEPRPCRDCGANILLLRSEATGNWMPVDDDATDDGNIRVDVYRNSADVLSGVRLAEARRAGEQLSLHHKVTCGAPNRARRRPATLFDEPDSPA